MPRLGTLLTVLALAVPSLATPAAGTARLSAGRANAALRDGLRSLMGLRHMSSTCLRLNPVRFHCRWRGRRIGRGYAGEAIVSLQAGVVTVQLSRVRRTAP
jgi:hypothetical protein